MTIKKAIEILTLMDTPEFNGHTEDLLDARSLGVEALKFYHELKHTKGVSITFHLPGESEE